MTDVSEIADGIFRISTPIPPSAMPGGFTFNQFLVVDDEPLLFHTGLRQMFPLVREAIAAVMPVERLRYLAFSHFEADECGALNDFLAVAPHATPVCSALAAMVQMNDLADRAPRTVVDGEALKIGRHELRWLDAPHVPHNWECGYMFETSTRTLLCGDLFTHGGHELPAVTESDVLAPSEALRAQMGGVAIEAGTRGVLEKLARTEPTTLALMHGSSYRGNGRAALLALADALGV